MSGAMKNPPPQVDHAWLQAASEVLGRGELEAALGLWTAFRQIHPTAPAGYMEAVRALREVQRYDEAEELCCAAFERGCADRIRFMIEYARIADLRGNMPEAYRRWMALDGEFPAHGAGAIGAIRALTKMQRYHEADTLASGAIVRFPDNPQMARGYAQVAAARQNWQQAIQRWDDMVARFPEDKAAARSRGVALWQLRLQSGGGEDEAGADAVPEGLVEVGRVADPEAYALVMQFESLGQNCEFGLVQRRYGAEPLGLLRWTFVRPLTLGHMLETRLRGVGDAENVDLHRSPWGEWYVQDKIFNMHYHTFSGGDLADPADYLKKQSARLRWLRDKLLSDLEDGSKIFVYKPRLGTPEAHIARIVRAMRTYGQAKLLCVRLADGVETPGTVKDRGNGLIDGFLSVHNPVVKGRWDIVFDEWLSLCRAVIS